MEEVIITFAGGQPVVSVTGHKGQGCRDLTAAVERALGQVVGDELTAEYREQPRGTAKQQAAGR